MTLTPNNHLLYLQPNPLPQRRRRGNQQQAVHENKRGISQPNCEHTLCIGCFKRCHYGKYNEETEENESKENLRKCPLCRK